MNERNQALMRLQAAEFALIDLGLYLDTHPKDQQALNYFTEYNNYCKQVRDAFVKMYGPISANDYSGQSTWVWVNEPWPWEGDL